MCEISENQSIICREKIFYFIGIQIRFLPDEAAGEAGVAGGVGKFWQGLK